MGTEVHNFPSFNGMRFVVDFIDEVDLNIAKAQKIPLLNVTFQVTPTRCWGAHRDHLQGLDTIKSVLICRFGYSQDNSTNFPKYEGYNDPHQHIQNRKYKWTRERLFKNL